MLRRVARVARNVPIAMGLACVVWFPVSFYLWASLYLPLSDHLEAEVECLNGRIDLVFITWDRPDSDGTFSVEWGRFAAAPAERQLLWEFLKPGYFALEFAFRGAWIKQRTISFPLWLLAFLCLSWPVTSFVIARRRRGTRGFEVEAVGGNAVSTVDS